MPNTTNRWKYIAIGANIFVILLSISILASLYIFSVTNLNGGDYLYKFANKKEREHNRQTVISVETLSSSLSPTTTLPQLKQQQQQHGVYNDDNIDVREQQDYSEKQKFAYLPALLRNFINWLGQSVLASQSKEKLITSSSSLFIVGRPLIVTAFLAYILAIVGSIAIGLEHVTLLIILIVIFVFAFASTLTALIFSLLTASLEISNNKFEVLILFDIWNCLLITITCVSALQVIVCLFFAIIYRFLCSYIHLFLLCLYIQILYLFLYLNLFFKYLFRSLSLLFWFMKSVLNVESNIYMNIASQR